MLRLGAKFVAIVVAVVAYLVLINLGAVIMMEVFLLPSALRSEFGLVLYLGAGVLAIAFGVQVYRWLRNIRAPKRSAHSFIACPSCGRQINAGVGRCEYCNWQRLTERAVPSTDTARSLDAAAWLRRAVIAHIAASASLALTAALVASTRDPGDGLVIITGVAALVLGFTLLAVLVLFGVWIYRLHRDLHVYYPGYPISPRQALARVFIPFYNLWGIWNLYTTLAQRLEVEGGTLAEAGRRLRAMVPWLYVVMFSSNVLGRIVTRMEESMLTSSTLAVMHLVSGAVDIGLDVIYLRLVNTCSQAVNVGQTGNVKGTSAEQ